MSANQPARRSPGLCRAARRAFRALHHSHTGQVCTWQAWCQANRAAVPGDGPLRWILTLDGYRLAGRHRPASTGRTP
jgi:hypothetical protein